MASGEVVNATYELSGTSRNWMWGSDPRNGKYAYNIMVNANGHGYYYDFQPHYTYRPVLERYVVFHNGRVSGWESRDLPYRGLQEPIPLQ